jgi:hypothetical protein
MCILLRRVLDIEIWLSFVDDFIFRTGDLATVNSSQQQSNHQNSEPQMSVPKIFNLLDNQSKFCFLPLWWPRSKFCG